MKKLFMLLCVMSALTMVVNADEPKEGKKKMSDEQKKLRTEMIAKYDANKDGKLSKEERTKMTAEEKEKWDKAFPARKKGEKKEKN